MPDITADWNASARYWSVSGHAIRVHPCSSVAENNATHSAAVSLSKQGWNGKSHCRSSWRRPDLAHSAPIRTAAATPGTAATVPPALAPVAAADSQDTPRLAQAGLARAHAWGAHAWGAHAWGAHAWGRSVERARL